MHEYVKVMTCVAVLLLLMQFLACSSSPPVYLDETTPTDSPTDSRDPNIYQNPIHNTDFEPKPLYQYFVLNGTLARFNITTGDVTYLCDDSLCLHGTECLFSDVGFDFWVDENLNEIYFVSDGRLIRYETASKKAHVLYEIGVTEGAQGNGGAQTSLSHGYYWYRDVYAEIFYRVKLGTGAYEQIDPAYDIPMAYIDGRYFCTSSSSPATEVYTLDANMQDKQTILHDCILYYVNFDHVNSQNSGYITFSEWCDGTLTPHTYDLATKQKAVFTNAPRSGETYGDCIFYVQTVDTPRLMGECGLNGKIYNRTGGTVYSYNTITNTEKILFSNDDLVIGSPQMVDRYLVYDFGAFVKHEVFDCPYWQTNGGGKLVIDVETGDYCIYFNTWDKTLTGYS